EVAAGDIPVRLGEDLADGEEPPRIEEVEDRTRYHAPRDEPLARRALEYLGMARNERAGVDVRHAFSSRPKAKAWSPTSLRLSHAENWSTAIIVMNSKSTIASVLASCVRLIDSRSV